MMKKYQLTFLTFFISIFFMLSIYAFLNITPFGQNTLMLWDMEWQYSSFLTWYHNVLLGDADWRYSLIGGFGGNTFGLFSYYLSSPLNFLLLFFNEQTMPWGILLLTLLKTGLMASSMQLYLFQKRKDFFSVLMGCMYALSSYAICYQFNIMWLDALVLLPVVVYGIEQLVDNSKGYIFALSLSLCIICNYFMGYIVCLFSLIYFLAYLFILKEKEHNSVYYVKSLMRFGIYALVAGGISAFIILPTIYNLSLSSNKHMWALAELFNQHKLFEYKDSLQYFMAGSFNKYQGITGGIPLIYCGIFPLFLVFVFFTSFKLSKRLKLFYFILLVFIFYSFNSQGLYLIWHGCYSPGGSPWRFSFLWTFLFLSVAYMGLPELKKENFFSLIQAICITVLFFAYIIWGNGYRKVALLNLCIINVLTILYFVYQNCIRKWIVVFSAMLALCVCGAELGYNALVLHSVQFPELYEELDKYEEKIETVEKLIECVRKENLASDVYRTEILNEAARSYNDGYLYNINSLTMYSSSEKQLSWELFSNLGWGTPVFNGIYDNNTTTLSRNLAGVKYIIDSRKGIVQYEEMAEKNGITLYRNVGALPLGFLVNESALDIKNQPTRNLFAYQNNLYHALVGCSDEDVYICDGNALSDYHDLNVHRIVELPDGHYTDGENIYRENTVLLLDTLDECKKSTISIKADKDSKIKGEFINSTNEITYVCFTLPYEKAWKAEIDGKQVEIALGMGGFLLVPMPSGKHTIELSYHVPYLGIGITVSLFSILLLMFLSIERRSGNNKRVLCQKICNSGT